jgi:hypothetical protein
LHAVFYKNAAADGLQQIVQVQPVALAQVEVGHLQTPACATALDLEHVGPCAAAHAHLCTCVGGQQVGARAALEGVGTAIAKQGHGAVLT